MYSGSHFEVLIIIQFHFYFSVFLVVLTDKHILEGLNDSEYSDESGDDIGILNDEYVPPSNEEVSQESLSDSSSEEDLPLQPRSGRGRVRGRGRGIQIGNNSASSEWQNKSFTPQIGPLYEPSYMPLERFDFTHEQYFHEYIDNELINLMVEKTNQMHIYTTGKSLQFTDKECRTFLAITMMMSCIGYPYIRMYWERKWRIPVIAEAMSRNRYFQLRTSLKLVFDPDITQEEKTRDKLWKVRPIIDRMLQGCQKQVKDQHVSIDEMIIPFSGSCGIKQYCPNKPNPVGLKAFVLANPDGTVCDFNIYQGDTTFPEEKAAGFGLGESAVLNLTRTLVPGHVLYFDRYFTSLKLVLELTSRGFYSAGTVMKNRIPPTLRNELPDDREMKKRGRGCSSVFVNSSDTVAVTKWFDNKPVVLLSTAYGSDPQDVCQMVQKEQALYRYSKTSCCKDV